MEDQQRVYRLLKLKPFQPLKRTETVSQGRMGSRRNGWIWRDDLDRLRHLLRRIVAEVSYIAHACKGRVRLTGSDEFSEKFRKGGGSFSIQKFILQNLDL